MISLEKYFAGQKVLVTGHTGFKGSWLSLWLQQMKADLVGFSLPHVEERSHFCLSGTAAGMCDERGDIRDLKALQMVFKRHQPAIVFHLAAQPLVLESFQCPKDTFDTNSGGTVNLLEAVRDAPSVKAVVLATSDKCYENRGWAWGYRENDSLGGNSFGGSDPYSASKAMAELVIASYCASFFKTGPAIASVRAGNVIGGGDFSPRLLPDILEALARKEPIRVRHPKSIRAWFYVLDCLYGYLKLATHLLEQKEGNGGGKWAHAWNFGPSSPLEVRAVVELCLSLWGEGSWEHVPGEPEKEQPFLSLNCDKAARYLNWKSLYSCQEALQKTIAWHKQLLQQQEMHAFCLNEIIEYTHRIQSCASLPCPSMALI
jgi:CDP-glucose 4,6-dehydratase